MKHNITFRFCQPSVLNLPVISSRDTLPPQLYQCKFADSAGEVMETEAGALPGCAVAYWVPLTRVLCVIRQIIFQQFPISKSERKSALGQLLTAAFPVRSQLGRPLTYRAASIACMARDQSIVTTHLNRTLTRFNGKLSYWHLASNWHSQLFGAFISGSSLMLTKSYPVVT